VVNTTEKGVRSIENNCLLLNVISFDRMQLKDAKETLYCTDNLAEAG
jgi:hypothetical protein